MIDPRLPLLIEIIALKCAMEFPVTLSELEEARSTYPKYFNREGEFDPYFKKRGVIKLILIRLLKRFNWQIETLIRKLQREF
jgi:hypothetical protein